MSWIPTYLTNELAVSTSTIAIVVSINAIVMLLTTVIMGMQLSKAFLGKEKKIVLISIIAIAILLPVFVTLKSVPLAIITIFVLTIMGLMAFTTLFTFSHKIFEQKIMRLAFGFVSADGTLGSFFANKIIGSLIESSGGYMSSFIFMSVITIVCGVTTLFIKKNRYSNKKYKYIRKRRRNDEVFTERKNT